MFKEILFQLKEPCLNNLKQNFIETKNPVEENAESLLQNYHLSLGKITRQPQFRRA